MMAAVAASPSNANLHVAPPSLTRPAALAAVSAFGVSGPWSSGSTSSLTPFTFTILTV